MIGSNAAFDNTYLAEKGVLAMLEMGLEATLREYKSKQGMMHSSATTYLAQDDADGEEAAADDQDNLDDMAAEADMAAPMLARARAIFDQLDTDGMGTLSKAELKAGLLADYDLQSLLGADADSAHAMMDLDGDGEISWMEFEMMFSSSSQAPEESTAIDLAATEEEAPPP
eukprot:jgi/Chrpa1/25183/Chrysochromulina_OHIO_Genome00008592-RA